MTETFRPGDEIEWRDKADRKRGRVVAVSGNALGVRPYDDLGRLDGPAKMLPAGAKRTSAVDRLAEVPPDLYHLIGDDAKACYCGGLDSDGAELRPLDPLVSHHAARARAKDVWSTLLRDTATDLDLADRSRPLDARQLPEGSADLARKAKLCAECFHKAVLASCYPEEPGRRTEDDLRQFVLAWMDRRVFSHRHCAPESMPLVFMCLTLMPPIPEDYAEKVGLIYEYTDTAAPRSINGCPCFFSHRLMHVDDWERVRKVISVEEERRENLVV